MNNKKVGVALVNYHNTKEIFDIANVYLTDSSISYLVIVNNDCDNTDLSLLDDLLDDRVRIINEKENLGYSKGNNIALKLLVEVLSCDYVIVSNSDVEFDEGVISLLIDKMEQNEGYGAMAPRMRQCDGSILPLRYYDLDGIRLILRVIVPRLDERNEKKLKYVNGLCEQSFLPGSFFMARGCSLKKCNYFDPGIFLYREEEILGSRMIKEGYKLGVILDCEYIHNHKYYKQDIVDRWNMLKMEMESERYYFRNYSNYTNIMMVHIYIWQFLFVCKELIKKIIKNV